MVFAFLPENTGAEARIFIELGLGSFQVKRQTLCTANTDEPALILCVKSLSTWNEQQENCFTEHVSVLKGFVVALLYCFLNGEVSETGFKTSMVSFNQLESFT